MALTRDVGEGSPTFFRRALAGIASIPVPLVALWVLAGVGLAAVTTRVTDWFVMTDELLYERLAISVAHGHSPLPEVRGQLLRSLDQLYPLLISPAFVHGLVPDDLRQAHLLNAWIMTSACIPAFLLARRVARGRWPAYFVAVLTLCTPWLVYAPFLMTEVAAYPAFLWGLLAMQCGIVAPSRRNDVLALLGIALAFFARTEFVALALVLPVALVVYGLHGTAPGPRIARVRDAIRSTVAAHRVVAVAYGVFAVAGVVLLAAGARLSSFTVYGEEVHGSLLPHGTPRAFVEHLATLSLGLGILPFVVGVAWLLANLVLKSENEERQAFACIGALTVTFLTLEVTTFDLRVGDFVHDRYLFYLVPPVLLAFACALLDRRRVRWSIVLPAGVIAFAFAVGAQPSFTWTDPNRRLNTDTPISAFFGLADRAAHGFMSGGALLAVGTIALAVLFVASARIGKAQAAIVFGLFALVVLPAETVYSFSRLLGVDDWASRPVTGSPNGALGWVDAAVGTHAHVAMVPAPTWPDVFGTQQDWRDLEFWNKSVDRDVHYPTADDFKFTGIFFPKTVVRLDASRGTVSPSPAPYVVESTRETRFRVSGPVLAQGQKMMLIDAGTPWRLDWLTSGLYDDGWTKPGVTARLRLFAAPGQRRARVRFLTLQVWAPSGVARRPFTVVSNLETRHGVASDAGTAFVNAVRVCVPAGGFSDVRLRALGRSSIPGDLRSIADSSSPRVGGVFLALIAEADEVGPACRAAG